MSRTPLQIRHLMLIVGGSAVLAAGLRAPEDWQFWLLIVGGPGLGSLTQQSMGGRGIVGGAIGGGAYGLSFALHAYFFSGTIRADLAGPWIGIPVFSVILTMVGLVVGAVIWGVRIQVEDRDARYPWWSPTDPSRPNPVDRD